MKEGKTEIWDTLFLSLHLLFIRAWVLNLLIQRIREGEWWERDHLQNIRWLEKESGERGKTFGRGERLRAKH